MNTLWLQLLTLMLVAPPGASVVCALVVTVATDLATRSNLDTSVNMLAIQDHYSCEQLSEGWGVLARLLTHSVVGTSGSREHESPVVILCCFWEGWSIWEKSQICLWSSSARLRVWDRRLVVKYSRAAQAARIGMVAVLTPTGTLTLCDKTRRDHSPRAGSDGIDIYSFQTARCEPNVSKLQKFRALSRKLLADFSIEEESTSPRRHLQ